MAEKTAGFEKGVNGATISTADAGDATPWNGVNGAPVYDNAHVHKGTLAAKFVASNSALFLEWNTTVGDSYGRFYLYITSDPLTTDEVVLNCPRNGGANPCSISLGGATTSYPGKIAIRNSSNIVIASTTAAIPLNQWVRVEYHYVIAPGGVAANSTLEARIWLNADSSGAPDYTLGPSTFVSSQTSITNVIFGSNGSNTFTWWMDDLDADALNWPGPTGTPPINITPPSISGLAQVEQQLTADPGVWQG